MGTVEVLTYASFSGRDGAGGWKVGQRGSGLSDDEVAALVEQIPTRLDAVEAIPRYPSAEEIRVMQRRMKWSRAPWPGEDRVFWFSSPAGEDSTGRAGNVFTQVHVFRGGLAGAPGGVRLPSDLLFSGALKFPFGAREVDATVVSGDAPPPGPLADPEVLWPWIFADEEVDRRAVLGAILDGLAAGLQVAVACPKDHAAMWIAAVCMSMSPAAAADLGWSTFDRAKTLDLARSRGIALACIPVGDAGEAAAARAGDVLVVRTDSAPATGVYGGAPTVVDGVAVPVSEWSELRNYLFLTASEAIDFSRRVSSGETVVADGGDPAWQMAAAVAADPDSRAAARAPLRGLLAKTGGRPGNVGELFDAVVVDDLLGFRMDGLRDDPVGALPALDAVVASGRDADDAFVEQVLDALERGGVDELVVGGAWLLRDRLPEPSRAMQKLLCQVTATSSALHEAISSGRGLPVDVARWLGVPVLCAELLAGARDAAPEEFRAPVWEGDLIGAWILGALSDGGAAAHPPSPRAKVFGLNSLVESLDDGARGLVPTIRDVLRELDGYPEQRLLAEGPWRPYLEGTDAAPAPHPAGPVPHADPSAWERAEGSGSAWDRPVDSAWTDDVESPRDSAADRAWDESDWDSAAEPTPRRGGEHPYAEWPAPAGTSPDPLAASPDSAGADLAAARVRPMPPRLLRYLADEPALGVDRELVQWLGARDESEVWGRLGEVALMAPDPALPDLDAAKRSVFAVAIAQGLLYGWQWPLLGLPWWVTEGMSPEEADDIVRSAFGITAGAADFTAASLHRQVAGDAPPGLRYLLQRVLATVDRAAPSQPTHLIRESRTIGRKQSLFKRGHRSNVWGGPADEPHGSGNPNRSEQTNQE